MSLGQLVYPMIVFLLVKVVPYNFGWLNGSLFSKIVVWYFVGTLALTLVIFVGQLIKNSKEKQKLMDLLQEEILSDSEIDKGFLLVRYYCLKDMKFIKIGMLPKALDLVILFLTFFSLFQVYSG